MGLICLFPLLGRHILGQDVLHVFHEHAVRSDRRRMVESRVGKRCNHVCINLLKQDDAITGEANVRADLVSQVFDGCNSWQFSSLDCPRVQAQKILVG